MFSGMLGVTLFGIFLTPVFFYVIQGLSETRLFSAASTRWIGSAVLGGLVGLATGYLLARLGVARHVLGAGDRRHRGDPGRLCGPWGPSPDHAEAGGRRTRSSLLGTTPAHPAELRIYDSAFLHRPAGLRHRALAGLRAGRRSGRLHAAGGAVSRGHAAHGAGDRGLPGRQRH